jgi:hypothetical protein
VLNTEIQRKLTDWDTVIGDTLSNSAEIVRDTHSSAQSRDAGTPEKVRSGNAERLNYHGARNFDAVRRDGRKAYGWR